MDDLLVHGHQCVNTHHWVGGNQVSLLFRTFSQNTQLAKCNMHTAINTIKCIIPVLTAVVVFLQEHFKRSGFNPRCLQKIYDCAHGWNPTCLCSGCNIQGLCCWLVWRKYRCVCGATPDIPAEQVGGTKGWFWKMYPTMAYRATFLWTSLAYRLIGRCHISSKNDQQKATWKQHIHLQQFW